MGHHCQLLNDNLNICENTNIFYSPKFCLYLCNDHEKHLISDHMYQFYNSQFDSMQYMNEQSSYQLFSDYTNKLLEKQNIIPQKLCTLSNKCYFKFSIDYEIDDNDKVYIRFIIDNIDMIQFGGTYINNTICCEYLRHCFYYMFKSNNLNENLDYFINKIKNNTKTFDNYNLISNSIIEINEDIHIYKHIYEILKVPNYNNSKYQLYLDKIEYCNICYNECIQYGYKLYCCNNNNQICEECVIKEQSNHKSKICSKYQITSFNMLNISLKCFFCRNYILYEGI